LQHAERIVASLLGALLPVISQEIIMHCKKEEYVEGSIFHFYNRTEKDKLLFKCDEDYLYFLKKFKANITRYPCEVYAYCLMPNHFHFCLKQISEQQIFGIFNAAMMSYSLPL
jgi:putative transposase